MFGIDDAVVGSVVGELGSSLLGGLFGGSSAKKQNKAAIEAQERANAFTREMMSSRHQWEVADLKAAGLNPILSAGGTPSMGGSAAAPVVDEGSSAREAAGRVGPTLAAARNAQLLRDQLKLQNSQIIAQTNSAQADARLKHAQENLTNVTAALDTELRPWETGARYLGPLSGAANKATDVIGRGVLKGWKTYKGARSIIKPSIKGVFK